MRASRPVGVLLMTRELDQGGVERDVAKIASYLDRERYQPHVASFHAHGMRYEDLRAAGVPVLPLPLKSLLSREALTAAARMRRYIRWHKIRIVHSYDASGVFGLPVGRIAGARVLIGSQLSYRAILDARTQRLLRWHDKFADAMLVNCEAMRRYMSEDEGIEGERIELCYNGVDTTVFFPNRRPHPGLPGTAALTIGTVCALRPEKGLYLLQQAFAKIPRSIPAIRLVIVGSGQELAGLKKSAAELGIAEASVFVPATRHVAPWLNAIDIFVLPSLSEAFSNSLLEAMACGCAVAGSRVGGTPELTGLHGERGLLFETGNVEDLAAQMRRLVDNPALRSRFGEQAAGFAKENLSIEIAARRTAEIYDRWLERKGVKIQ